MRSQAFTHAAANRPACPPSAGRRAQSHLKTMRILNKGELVDFVRERRELFDAAAPDNPFASSAWTLHFIEHVASPEWTFVVPQARLDGESVMLLYGTRGSRRFGALTNYYASLYSPLISSARNRQAALQELAGQLGELKPPSSAINFSPLDAASGETDGLRAALTARGWYVRRYACSGNWRLPCEGMAFAEYMQRRPAQLYNTWLRKSKRFLQAPRAKLAIATTTSEVESAIESYESVYARSWKAPEPYRYFVPGWARVCAANGWLRLGIASIDGIPVAAQFWFVMNRRAFIFKLAHDEAHAKWSAGTLLTAHMIEHCLELDRVVEIDYLSGDDAYKNLWMSERRERVGLMACNLGAPGGWMLAASEAAGALRQRWRRERIASE